MGSICDTIFESSWGRFSRRVGFAISHGVDKSELLGVIKFGPQLRIFASQGSR